ncbi:hypothetical protein [Bacillus sp. AK031]
MGYIAPVPHYQYMQYAEREANKEYDPFTFMPINRIRPLMNKAQRDDTGVDQDTSLSKLKDSRKRFRQAEGISPDFLADITGKGKYINEYV